MHARMYVCMYGWRSANACIHVYICSIHVSMHVSMYVYVYIYIYIHTHTHSHTHIHTYIYNRLLKAQVTQKYIHMHTAHTSFTPTIHTHTHTAKHVDMHTAHTSFTHTNHTYTHTHTHIKSMLMYLAQKCTSV